MYTAVNPRKPVQLDTAAVELFRREKQSGNAGAWSISCTSFARHAKERRNYARSAARVSCPERERVW